MLTKSVFSLQKQTKNFFVEQSTRWKLWLEFSFWRKVPAYVVMSVPQFLIKKRGVNSLHLSAVAMVFSRMKKDIKERCFQIIEKVKKKRRNHWRLLLCKSSRVVLRNGKWYNQSSSDLPSLWKGLFNLIIPRLQARFAKPIVQVQNALSVAYRYKS